MTGIKETGETSDWLAGLPPSHDWTAATARAQPMPRSPTEYRQLGDIIKAVLRASPMAKTLDVLLRQMEHKLGLRVDRYEYESPGLRLVWDVTFDYESAWCCHYFVVRRFFAGQELDPRGSHYLGPAWEPAPSLLAYTEDELEALLAQETIEVRSAAGIRRCRYDVVTWEKQLRQALCAAYQHPLCRG